MADIRTYQVDPAREPKSWELEAFIARCATTTSGPAPSAMAGSSTQYAWKPVLYDQRAELAVGGQSAVAYFTDGNGLDPVASQCALVMQLQSQLVLFYSALPDLTASRCASLVQTMGGPSELLLAAILTAVSSTSDFAFALGNMAQAIAGPDQPPANGNIVGISNFAATPCGISPAGYFGTYRSGS